MKTYRKLTADLWLASHDAEHHDIVTRHGTDEIVLLCMESAQDFREFAVALSVARAEADAARERIAT